MNIIKIEKKEAQRKEQEIKDKAIEKIKEKFAEGISEKVLIERAK